MPFIDQLLQSHGDVLVASLARHLQLSPEEARRVIGRTVPLVLGGLARQAKTRGPDAVTRILNDHGDEAALTDTENYLERQANSKDPLGGLGSLLGGGGLGGGLASLFGNSIANMVTGAMASFLQVDQSQAARVLPMLVPLIMASLQQQANGADSPGLASVLTLLEQEGDASALEELAAKILGGGPLGGMFR